jgi:hypothetical protein
MNFAIGTVKGAGMKCLPGRFFSGRTLLLRILISMVLFPLAPGLVGCFSTVESPSDGTVASGPTTLTGNWQFQLSPTGGALPFASLAGSIDEQTTGTSSGFPLTASLQYAQPSTCFLGYPLIPLHGSLTAAQLYLYSFTVDAQFLTLTATANSNDSQLSGTYVVNGGCTDNASGSLTGVKYAPLTGTYTGSLTGGSANSLTATLSQSDAANGDGTFSVVGSVALAGVPCFSTGTLAGQSGFVIGQSVNLSFLDSDNSQLTIVGTFDPAADTITVSSINIVGGNCAGSLGNATLKLQ